MFERILIPVDFSAASGQALHCGTRLSEKCNSEVFIVHVLSFLANVEQASKYLVPGTDLFSVFRKELDEFTLAEPNLHPNLDVLVHDDASAEILKYSKEHKCRLIVIGSHGHSAFVNTLLGSVTQKLMRASSIPLMIVPAFMDAGKELRFENILVPIDFSAISFRALRLGTQIARTWNSTLHVVHVVDKKAIEETQKNAVSHSVKMEDLDVVPTLQQLLERLEFAGASTVSTLYGDPDEEILQYTRENSIDFMIMGSHGRKGLDRVLIGSVTASVVRHAQVPIITLCEPFQANKE